MDRSRPMAAITTLAALLLALAACSSAASPGATEGEAPPSAAASEAPSVAASQAGSADSVTISGSSFGDDITISVGTTVTVTNGDTFAHTVTEGTEGTAVDGARFDEEVAAGESVEITFDEAGIVDVTCKFHPTMSLVVTVEG